MKRFNPFVALPLLALAVPAGVSAQNKVFLCPTTSTTAVAGGGTRATYALDNAEKTAAKLQARSISTEILAGGTASTAAKDAANAFGADAFVAVTSQAAAGAHGFESWYYSPSASGKALAESVQAALAAAYPLADRPNDGNRGAKSDATHDTWVVLKDTWMPAIVTYVVFDDCTTAHASLPGGASESAFLRSDSGRSSIAGGFEAGLCAWSGLTCSTGGTCVPSTEICDGKDNDCDNSVDEGNPGGGVACSTGSPGVCGAGTKVCQGGSLICKATSTPTAEICNGADDDCDSQTDEGNPGGGAACQTGQPGICASGTRTCTGGSLVCQPTTPATTESCNSRDDNCDGQTDEGNPGGGAACSTGSPGECGRGTSTCQGGTLACVQSVQPSAEICDGKDNDCNGSTDEGNPDSGGECGTGQKGVCGIGRRDCSTGNLVCVQVNQPSTEICDGLDNDCDGTTDEEIAEAGGACSTGLPGACAQGELRCVVGELGCVQKAQPTEEICDGLDNDCSGQTDEGGVCQGGADAGLPPADAGDPDGTDAGSGVGPAPEVPESGCGCSAGPDGSGLLALFALAGLKRRRQSR